MMLVIGVNLQGVLHDYQHYAKDLSLVSINEFLDLVPLCPEGVRHVREASRGVSDRWDDREAIEDLANIEECAKLMRRMLEAGAERD